jgi:choline-sulfatase
MIRRGDYKYNYYVNDMAELYNLREDPKEMRNLALEPASAGKVAEMKAQLFAWHKPDRYS